MVRVVLVCLLAASPLWAFGPDLMPAVASAPDVSYELTCEEDLKWIPTDARALDLSGLAPADFGLLESFPKIEHVDLGSYDRNGDLTTEAMSAVASCKTLMSVKACNLSYFEAGWLTILSGLPKLEQLNVRRSIPPFVSELQVPFDELAGLIEATPLKALNLGRCLFYGEGALFWDVARKLKTLNLWGDIYGVEGPQSVGMQAARLPLAKLEMRDIEVDDDVLAELGRRKSLETLSLVGCEGVSVNGLRLFVQSTKVVQLGLLQIDDLTDDHIKLLSGMRSLTSLDISYGVAFNTNRGEYSEPPESYKVTGAAFTALASMSNLKWLSVAGSPAVTDKSLTELGKSSSIELLNICGCRSWTSKGFAALFGSKAIRRLYTGRLRKRASNVRDPFDNECLKLVAEYGKLNHLCMYNNDSITSVGARVLGQIQALEGLQITGSAWFDVGVAKEIRKLKKLTFLNLSGSVGVSGSWGNGIEEGLKALEAHPTIEYLWVYGCGGITKEGLASIQTLPALKSLDIRGNNVEGNATVEQRRAFVGKLRKRDVCVWHHSLAN